MSKAPLPTYLRTHRKRSGLSQGEVAFLIATESGTTISRHETSRRAPSLLDALAYEALFGVPVSALFPGEYEKARSLIEQRAVRLLERLSRSDDQTPVAKQKLQCIERLLRRVRM